MTHKAVSSLEDAFLQTILEHPDHDTPRLVFADWLEEQGNPRGTFIRLQCQRHGLTHRDAAFKELLAQESTLLRHHEKEWSKTVLRLVDEVEYRRGFIEHVGVTAAKFLKNAQRLFRIAPVRSVKLSRLSTLWPQLADCPQLARVLTLNLSHNSSGMGSRSLQTLFQSPYISALSGLRLFDCALGPASAEVLASAPRLARLQALELGRNPIGDGGIAALARSPHLAQLRELSLCNNLLKPESAVALASAPLLRLTHLDLGENVLGNEGAAALASSPALAELRRLDLRHNQISNLGVETLAHSPYLQRLEHLDLHGNHINDRGVQTLAASALLSQLAYLNLENNEFSAVATQALAKSPNLPRMRQLLLGRHAVLR